MTLDETLQAKLAFEAYAKSHGVKVLQYHADNGRFADKAFRKSCEEQLQNMSFCGVNAHFQNGIAEKRIRDLQDGARTMLLHTQRRWPDAINTHLWPYAMRMANDVHNNSPLTNRQASPIELFSGSTVQPQLKHFHHFESPVYVLGSALQAGKKIRKWSERARIGINLGNSPQHAKSVALVLSRTSGNVSPQYHCSFDDLFETTTGSQAKLIPKPRWQEKAHFRKTREPLVASEAEGMFTLPPEATIQEAVQHPALQPVQEVDNMPNQQVQVDLPQQQQDEQSRNRR